MSISFELKFNLFNMDIIPAISFYLKSAQYTFIKKVGQSNCLIIAKTSISNLFQ